MIFDELMNATSKKFRMRDRAGNIVRKRIYHG
jgi:hypothetical protein